jgi:hypothetical protein
VPRPIERPSRSTKGPRETVLNARWKGDTPGIRAKPGVTKKKMLSVPNSESKKQALGGAFRSFEGQEGEDAWSDETSQQETPGQAQDGMKREEWV